MSSGARENSQRVGQWAETFDTVPAHDPTTFNRPHGPWSFDPAGGRGVGGGGVTGLLEAIDHALGVAVGLAWNYPVVIMCLGTGLYLTLRLGFIQVRGFRHALVVISGKFDRPDETGHITHFQALSAAVSGTVGLGNIAGVAIAIAMGGPGAVFWMWMIGLLGMATKFTECGLATYYREQTDGEVRGGPMYTMLKGLGTGWKPVAGFFAFCTAIASLGGGNMFQSNQAAAILEQNYGVPPWVSGLLIAALAGLVIIGGIKRIGQVAAKIVPLMCGIYVVGAILICLFNFAHLPSALGIIFTDAFSGQAAAGGAIGTVIIMGVRRAVFSSESGLGSAPMAHAAARTNEPMRQGVVALLEPFIDTIVVCSATAIVIVLSGLYGEAGKGLEGVALTTRAFDMFIPGFGSIFVTVAVVLFAYSTAITWSYYGETGAAYVLGPKAVRPFQWIFVAFLFIGAVWKLGPVLNFSDLMLALMAIPNTISILLLSNKAAKLTREYFGRMTDMKNSLRH